MVYDVALRVGLDVISTSGWSEKTKGNHSRSWAKWVPLCEQAEVSPLAATGGEVLRVLDGADMTRNAVTELRKGVNYVYRALGMASPFRERRVNRHLLGENVRHGPAEGLGALTRRHHDRRVQDYLAWCEFNGLDPLPGSGSQVADFLRHLSQEYGSTSFAHASAAVSRYLEENGHPGTAHHPAVSGVLGECYERIASRAKTGSGEPTSRTAQRNDGYERQWRRWCESESIEWELAGSDDALRYLQSLEHQSSAATRVAPLSKLYEEMESPFSSEDVLAWARWHRRALADGTLSQVGHEAPVDAVIERMRDASVVEPEVVPVGLTRKEVMDLDHVITDQYEEKTIRNYAGMWVRFERWLLSRGIPLEKVVGKHVGVYLSDLAKGDLSNGHRPKGVRFSYVRNVADGLAVVFDGLGFADNPALSADVGAYLEKLHLEREGEAPSQVDGFREVHYQAVVANGVNLLPGEKASWAELRWATDVAIFGLMFDGMLRGVEAAAARWEDLSRFADGSGRLLVPVSKTDRSGEGAYTYVSPRSMEALDRMLELRRRSGHVKPGDGRIFQLGVGQLGKRIVSACRAAGFEDRFGTHSMRIGMAQELALAGFGLVLIMQAGRWKSPNMPAYYIRGLKASEAAVAQLHRAWADGKWRVDWETKGFDVLTTYYGVRFGN